MCGNFGLLLLGKNTLNEEVRALPAPHRDAAWEITRETMKLVSDTGGLIIAQDLPAHLYLNNGSGDAPMSMGSSPIASSRKRADEGGSGKASRRFHFTQPKLLSPLKILEQQTAMTEVRGGQAGGYSLIEHRDKVALAAGTIPSKAIVNRVRLVARKRILLAADLTQTYLSQTAGHDPASDTASLTCIGHTRFATSSINIVSELHPHEWAPLASGNHLEVQQRVGPL